MTQTYMENNILFTPAERKETLDLLEDIRKALGTTVEEDDERNIKQYIRKGSECIRMRARGT